MQDTFKGAANPLVTRAELEARLKNRPRPTARMDLTPQGWKRTVVNRNVDLQAEQRIKELKGRLDQAQTKLRADRGKAALRGRAAQDFERSR